jgi:hypothetical protein
VSNLPDNARLAVLIDADNTSATHAAAVLEEITKYGTATVRRAYGDWTDGRLQKWKPQLNLHAIQPIQQFAYTTGKNATDFALVIDAMDLLYAGHLDGFVIVSSDSDFTRLATRLRESAKVVYGIGARKTPQAFVAGCDRFIYLELLAADAAADEQQTTGSDDAPPPPPIKRILTAAIESTSQDDGWSALGGIGSHLVKTHPSFDPRLYGHTKLSNLVKAQSYVEVRSPSSGAGSTVWVRIKPAGEGTAATSEKKPTKSEPKARRKSGTKTEPAPESEAVEKPAAKTAAKAPRRTAKKAVAQPESTAAPAAEPATPVEQTAAPAATAPEPPKVTQRTRRSARTP